MMDTTIFLATMAVLGLCIGSFLNVVIYRLPKMMERAADRDVAEFLGKENPHPDAYNLVTPASTCGGCNKKISWYANIPVFGWLFLGGKCEKCKTPFSIRYPAVEFLTGVSFFAIAWIHGQSIYTIALSVFMSFLIALTLIDVDTQLLPDDLTLPAMWLGLVISVTGFGQMLPADAVLGAAAGYLFLWLIFWAFKLITGKEGMGYGDFKWLAAIGAWVGIQGLLPVILVASISGVIYGIGTRVLSKSETPLFAFGPFLSMGALVQLYWPIVLI